MKIIRADAYRPFLGSKIEICEIGYPFSSFYGKRPAFWIEVEEGCAEACILGPFDSFEEAEEEMESILALD